MRTGVWFFVSVLLASYCAAHSVPPTADQFRSLDVRNQWKLYPLLNDIAASPDFRYFHVNLDAKCPFWVQDFMCGLGGPSACSICPCSDEEIRTLQGLYASSSVDRSTPEDGNDWISQSMRSMCDSAANGGTGQGQWVDLTRNPESNTGFAGPDARRVWSAIYSDNCNACGDETFLRLVSGLHHSISVHIARNYFDSTASTIPSGQVSNGFGLDAFVQAVDQPKADELMQGSYWGRFLPSRKIFDDRIRGQTVRMDNMYFTYAFLLRAIHKYSTMNPRVAGKALGTHLSAYEIIANEVPLDILELPNELLSQNLDRMRQHFRNITEILECVTCEKCRLWSKLQFLGLGTALRIMTTPTGAALCLTPNEMVALLNAARQISASIEAVRAMESYGRVEKLSPYIFLAMQIFAIICVLSVAGCFIKRFTRHKKSAKTKAQ